MTFPLPPHALAPEPGEDAVPSYPAPLDPAALAPHIRDNPIVQLYLALAPQHEAEFAAMAASDAEDDEAIAAALVASVR